MPAISYLKENIEKHDFANKILQGIKIHTIRKIRKNWIFKINDRLVHYAMQRNPKGFKIIENKCLYVADIEIIDSIYLRVFINKKEIRQSEINKLAINDGFDNYEEFKDYFTNSGLPFHGQIIGWKEGINYG